MKIVYLINSLGAGGAERHLLNLVRDMAIRGYDIWVVALEEEIRGGATSLDSAFTEAGADVHYLNSIKISDIGRWMSLVRFLKKVQPDIIHSHLPRSDLAASISKLFISGMYWVSTIHDAYTQDKYSGYWVFPFIKWNWQRIDHIISVSRHVQEWGVVALGVPLEKSSVIYHGVPIYDISDSSRKEATEPLVIGCLARFEKRKGIETLVRAMVEVSKSYPDAQLLLAGNDPTEYSYVIKNLIRKLSIEKNVKVLGFCATPLDFLNSLDVFAFASTSEGFGMVLIEAMSVKCPVVGSDIYPINHIVQNGKTGILVSPGDYNGFAVAIVDLLKASNMRQEMGENGYRRCINEFSLGKSLNNVHDLYVELIS